MDKKITKREVITAMLALDEVKANQAFVDYLNHEIELLDGKVKNRKPSKSKKASDELVDTVIETIKALEKPATVTEIIKSNPALTDCSTQRMTAILKGIEGIKKEVVKGKSLYSL